MAFLLERNLCRFVGPRDHWSFVKSAQQRLWLTSKEDLWTFQSLECVIIIRNRKEEDLFQSPGETATEHKTIHKASRPFSARPLYPSVIFL